MDECTGRARSEASHRTRRVRLALCGNPNPRRTLKLYHRQTCSRKPGDVETCTCTTGKIVTCSLCTRGYPQHCCAENKQPVQDSTVSTSILQVVSPFFFSCLPVGLTELSHLGRRRLMEQPRGCFGEGSCARGRRLGLWLMESSRPGRPQSAGRSNPAHVTQSRRLWNSIKTGYVGSVPGPVPPFVSKGKASRSWPQREETPFQEMAPGTMTRPSYQSSFSLTACSSSYLFSRQADFSTTRR